MNYKWKLRETIHVLLYLSSMAYGISCVTQAKTLSSHNNECAAMETLITSIATLTQ